ncbi:unnamed protein product [Chrysoparadoxa australica]
MTDRFGSLGSGQAKRSARLTSLGLLCLYGILVKGEDPQCACNLPRVKLSNGMSIPLGGEPVIYEMGPDWNKSFAAAVAKEQLLYDMGDIETVLTGSDTWSSGRVSTSLREYVASLRGSERGLEEEKEEGAEQASGMPYLFGDNHGGLWDTLVMGYERPPCQGVESAALSFGIGGYGSGVGFHSHGGGFSEVLHGTKHWLLYHPDHPFNWDGEMPSATWYTSVYPTLKDTDKPLECTIKPGEVLYFPSRWVHAVVNTSPYTAFVSTFLWEGPPLQS